MHKRTVALFAALLFAFSGIVARVFRLTTGGDAQGAATAQSTVTLTIATARGTLYDRQLKRLTNTATQYAAGVSAVPSALAALSSHYATDEWSALRKRLEEGKPVSLLSDTVLPLAEGIVQFPVPQRYTDGDVAAHLIGYVGEDGIHGVSGAELALDDQLAEAGRLSVTYQTDGTGRVLPGGEVTVENTLSQANAGAALTIDRDIQAMVEIVAGESISRGAAVVLEIATGDILAAASFPDFDQTNLAAYLDKEGSPLFNRVTAAYNCGSVFKSVTAMAALEQGVPSTQSFTCLGAIPVGKNRIACHHRLGHGTLVLGEGYAQSCNPYFIQLAQLTGGTAVHRYASLLGFDSPLLLTEGWQTDRATLPSDVEMQQAARLANVAIGQGDLLATPLHIAAMTACIASGGEYRRPNLLYGTVDVLGTLTRTDADPPSRVCTPPTAARLQEMMCQVVQDGTGTTAAPSVGTAGGKTGTAETGWSTADGNDTMVHSWFTGFYPAEQPQYVVTVLAEDTGTTGEATAPVFRRICDQLYRHGYVTLPAEESSKIAS